jgi:hypothetical protein
MAENEGESTKPDESETIKTLIVAASISMEFTIEIRSLPDDV